MKISLISDTHLEYNMSLDFKIPKADVVVCAGDIGSPFTHNYRRFLEVLTETFKYVIVIAGNHEYYQHSQCYATTHPRSITKTETQIKKVCDDVGAIFLQKDFVDIGNVRFYGCTLWGDPSSSKGEKFWKDRYDCKHISDFQSIEHYQALHHNHREWLTQALTDTSSTTDKTIIVITHHLPSHKLVDPKFAHSRKNGYYTSHCDELLGKCDVWLAGHTHRFIEEEICGTRFYCNPVGYPWEPLVYNTKLRIEI